MGAAKSFLAVYEGKELACLQGDGALWFSIQDIAKAVNVPHQQIHRLLSRHRTFFGPYLANTSGPDFSIQSEAHRPSLHINHLGLTGVLLKLELDRMQDPARKTQVEAFQRWAVSLVASKLREGAAPQFRAPERIREFWGPKAEGQVWGAGLIAEGEGTPWENVHMVERFAERMTEWEFRTVKSRWFHNATTQQILDEITDLTARLKRRLYRQSVPRYAKKG